MHVKQKVNKYWKMNSVLLCFLLHADFHLENEWSQFWDDENMKETFENRPRLVQSDRHKCSMWGK